MIDIVVFDPEPNEIAPIRPDEIKDALTILGYKVRNVLVRNDGGPPYWLVLSGKRHVGPFSTRTDASTALDIAGDGWGWELLSDYDFHVYMNGRGR